MPAGPDFWVHGEACNLGGRSGRVSGKMAPLLPKVAFAEGVAGQQVCLAPLNETSRPVQLTWKAEGADGMGETPSHTTISPQESRDSRV